MSRKPRFTGHQSRLPSHATLWRVWSAEGPGNVWMLSLETSSAKMADTLHRRLSALGFRAVVLVPASLRVEA